MSSINQVNKSGLEAVYQQAIANPKYKNYMSDVNSLGSEIMKVLGEDNKILLERYEKSRWLAEEICIEIALSAE